VPPRRARAGTERGRFLIEGLSAGRYDVALIGDTQRPILRRGVAVATGETVDMGDVALAQGGVLVGEVRDEAGAPLAGVAITATAQEDVFPYPQAPRTRTCAQGRFRLGPMPASPTTLRVQKLGYEPVLLPTATVADGAEHARPPITLRARPDRAPAPDARGAAPTPLAPPVVSFVPGPAGLSAADDAGTAAVPGVQPGARLVTVAGYLVTLLTSTELRALLWGPPGSAVDVELLLPSANTPTVLRLPRADSP